jgi:hypothetical protein
MHYAEAVPNRDTVANQNKMKTAIYLLEAF